MIKKILLLSVCFLGLHLTVYPQWVIIDSTATNELTSVFFPTRDTGYAVGYFQYIIKTTNGGNTWITQSNPNGTTLSSVYFTDANTGFAVGDGGLVLKTTNGGNNWDTVFYSTFNFDNFMSVFFPSKNIGYILEAGNNKNYKTVDGGNTWIAQPYTWANGGTIGSIFFTDTVTGYAAVLGGIFKTTDGGNTWAKKDSSTAGYNSIFFSTKDTGYAVTGGGHILKTVDAGNNWTTYLTGLTGNSGLHSVYFTSSNTGYAVGGDFMTGGNGVIFKTTDGGLNWTPQTISSFGGPMLSSVFFTGKDTGYAVGGGAIFKTTTGGVTSLVTFKNLNDKFKVYPNPASKQFTIETNSTDKLTMDLYSANGRHIFTKNVSNYLTIDVDNLDEGFYTLAIKTETEVINKKLVILR